jgi:hypothetical protein
MSIRNWIFGAVLGLAVAFGAVAKPVYQTLPPVTTQAITNEVSGVWIPVNPTLHPQTIGLSLTVISGKYFIPAQWPGTVDTCGNYLGIRGSFPKSNPNTAIAGERDILDPTNPVNFGTEFLIRIPGRPGIASYVRIDSFDPVANQLTVTFSQNTFGFNGTIVLARAVHLYYPTPLGCHL